MFNIKHTACDSAHSYGEVIYHVEDRDFYILIFTKSEAEFIIDGKDYVAGAGSIVLLAPESKAVYSGRDDIYSDDWVNYYDVQNMCSSFGIPMGKPVFFGLDSSICAYFMLITSAFHSGLAQKNSIIDNLMMALFQLIGDHCSNDAVLLPHYNRLLNLRQRLYANPQIDYSIPKLAAEVGLSSVYFQELYKKAFGISCGADIINSRIENAKRLLSENSLSIEEIAERCGYKSIVHFSRQFKQLTGSPPSKWRQMPAAL